MRTIIAGSRSITNYDVVNKATIDSKFDITEVISGTARGVDQIGELWAKNNNIPVEKHPADWDKYGKSAGYIRNEEMAKCSDALIAIWDGESKGTKHMLDLAVKHGLKIFMQGIKI